jgi:subtilisin-like proprotein convertase family protein
VVGVRTFPFWTVLFLAVAAPLLAFAEEREVTVTATYDLDIADDPIMGVLQILQNFEVLEVHVRIDVTHPRPSDLSIRLGSPSRTWVELAGPGDLGAITSDPVGWFPGDFTPAEDLAILAGEPMTGPWHLQFHDPVEGFEGVVNEWSLRILYDDAGPAAPASFGRVKTLF